MAKKIRKKENEPAGRIDGSLSHGLLDIFTGAAILVHTEERPLRIVAAVAAFDGHEASVLALNRTLLNGAKAVDVIYLGFNMSCEKISVATLQEGVEAVAVSSYNSGHLQFYPHLLERLVENGIAEALLFGGHCKPRNGIP